MIKHLVIKNYALIESLEITPSSALNVITGETGAGKSIMLGALGLLLGKRADKKSLFNGKDKCIIEGIFDLNEFNLKSFFEENDLDYQQDCIVRREITPAGKSRAFINDTPTNLEVLKTLGSQLVDIHSQHDTLMLSEASFQLNIIDQFAENGKLLADYKIAYQDYTNKKDTLTTLKEAVGTIKKEYDYHHFLLNELNDSQLEKNELEQLESTLEILENSEEIKTKFNQVISIADESDYSVSSGMATILTELKTIKSFSSSYDHLFERFNSLQIELEDVINEVRNLESDIEVDPEELHQKRDRLDLIQRLLQKHTKKNVSELLDLQEELNIKVNQAENYEEEIQNAESALKNAEEILFKLARKLQAERKKIIGKFEKSLVNLLQKVGMPEASIKVSQNEVPPGKFGIDQINILFSANKGLPPQPLKNVASGGEFSRLMFCIKSLMADKSSMPTMVFDEIDTGVSGEIALRMIRLMKDMASRHQVISISHLPQFAAGADFHYYVYKDNASNRSVSKMKILADNERVEHIAKMIGGEKITDSALQNAKELLDIT